MVGFGSCQCFALTEREGQGYNRVTYRATPTVIAVSEKMGRHLFSGADIDQGERTRGVGCVSQAESLVGVVVLRGPWEFGSATSKTELPHLRISVIRGILGANS